MLDNIFFSIIVPVYNTSKYLQECIDSVLEQSFDDYELILVDDGSTDNSSSICDNNAYRHKERIYVFHKTNEGQLLSRQFGVSHSKGNYILFLDSDDRLRSDALKVLYEHIKIYKSDIVIYNLTDDKTFTKNNNRIFLENRYLDKKDIFKIIIKSNMLNSMCTKAFNKRLFEQNWIDSKYHNVRNGEDLIQFLKVLEKSDSITYINNNIYFYRNNEQSSSHAYSEDRLKSIDLYGEILKEKATHYFKSDELISVNRSINTRILNDYFDVLKIILAKDFNKNKKQLLINFCNNKYYNYYKRKSSFACLSIKNRILYILTSFKMYNILILLYRVNNIYHRI